MYAIRSYYAIMAEKDGKYTVAIVNSHYSNYEIKLKSDFLSNITMNKYSYKAKSDGSFEGKVDVNGFASPEQSNVSINFKDGVDIALQGESFILYTNME